MTGPRPVFVVGYMHSGTTLVRNILARNQTVYSSRGETKYFDLRDFVRGRFERLDEPPVRMEYLRFAVDLIEGTDNLKVFLSPDVAPVTPAERVVRLLGDPAALQGGHDALFVRTFDALAREAGRETWLEKTPSNVNHVERILRVAPAARFVEVVRDPRDVVASKKTRRRNAVEGERYKPDQRRRKRLANAYDPALDALGWKSAIRAGRMAARRHEGRVHRVRYEDLVERPEERTRELCAFLDLEFDPAMLDVGYRNTAAWRGRKQAGAGRRGGISGDSVGRWRQVLEGPETALCQWMAGRDAVSAGYAPVTVPVRHRLRAALRLGSSVVDLVARVGRRWRLGGRGFGMFVVDSWRRRIRFLRERP